MEELIKVINLMNEKQDKTNELLKDILERKKLEKDPNELLTAEQIVEEYEIGKVKVLKIFQDPNLPVQRYTKPFKIMRKVFEKYFETRHDDLCDKDKN